MAGPLIQSKEELQTIAKLLIKLFFLFILLPILIFIVWFICFISYAGLTSWPIMETNRFLIITGVSVSMICASLGIGSGAKILELKSKFEIGIWTAFLGGLFLAVVGWLNAIEI